MRHLQLTTWLAPLLLALTACRSTPTYGPPTLMPSTVGDVARAHTQGGIYLTSQPSAEAFEAAKAAGVVTVIDQRGDAETPEFDERAVVTGLGLEYHNPTFGGPLPLTDEVLDETRALLRDAPKPLLIHCASANRTGTVWLAYRVLDCDVPIDEALIEAQQVGLRSEKNTEYVLDYVRRNSDG